MRLFDKLNFRMHLLKMELWTRTTIHLGVVHSLGWAKDYRSVLFGTCTSDAAQYFGCTDYQMGSSPGST